MTTSSAPSVSTHLAYEDPRTPEEMHGDCAVVARNIRVPVPRRAEAVATTLLAAPRKAAVPVIAVTDRLAKMAASLLD